MAVEAKRGCGYRKVGGLYLVGGPGGLRCDRLPIELTVCPCCGHGIKQTRGWTWVDIAGLVGGDHAGCLNCKHADEHPLIKGAPMCMDDSEPGDYNEVCGCSKPDFCTCAPFCPLCHNVAKMGRGGLLWIGREYYPSIEAFELEAGMLGVSRRVHSLPRGFELGKTWVLLAHPRGVTKTEGLTTVYVPAIFRVWKPERVERIYKESDRGSEAALADEKRGITPVYVPDNDPDHQKAKGKEDDEAEATPPLFA